MTRTQDVIIIGGGISGVAAAYELARRGVAVTLVEKGELASMASGWTLGGVRQSGRHPAELPLAQAAVRRWEVLSEELGADVEYRQQGNLRLARTPQEADAMSAMVEEQRALGLDLTFLPDTQSVREVAPALSEHVLAASFCPTDGHANPTATVRAFADAAARHGATIITGTGVDRIVTDDRRVIGVETNAGPLAAGVVVVAAGIYSDRLCATAGVPLPLHHIHVSAVQTVPLPPMLGQVLGVANADFAGRQEADGRLRMTISTGDWHHPAGPLAPDEIQPPAYMVSTIIERGAYVLPAVREARINRVWGGLLDMTPDGLPVIERTPGVEGLVVAAGFSGHGFCLGPITGQLIAELVTGETPCCPLDPFRLARFATVETDASPELLG